MNKIAYVPLDDRPCNLKFPQKLAEIAGERLLVPPKEILGQFKTPGDCEKIISWLLEISTQVQSIVVSAEMLAFGGLIASRNQKVALNIAQKRLEVLKQIKKDNPDIKTSLFTLITRHNKDNQNVQKRNHQINLLSLELIKEGISDFLVVGEDDVSQIKPIQKEKEQISSKIPKSLKEKVHLFCGADEIGMMLVARELAKNSRPLGIYVNYLDEGSKNLIHLYEDMKLLDTINAHAKVLNFAITNSENDADLIFYVANPQKGQFDMFLDDKENLKQDFSQFIDGIKKNLKSGKPCAIADVLHANGADPDFIEYLISNIRFQDLSSFSAWDTSSNTSGSCLSIAMIFLLMKNSKDKKWKKLHENFVLERIIDDYYYQSILRRKIKGDLEKRNISPFDLEGHFPPVEWVVKQELPELSKKILPKNLKLNISLPWPRIFEVEVVI